MAKPTPKGGRPPNLIPMPVLESWVLVGKYSLSLAYTSTDTTQRRDGRVGGQFSLYRPDSSLMPT
jgi:hypothetical protein